MIYISYLYAIYFLFDFQKHTEEIQNESLNNLDRYLCKNFLEEVTEC